MELEGITCKPFNASLMGVIAGVADYYKLDLTDAELLCLIWSWISNKHT